MKFIAKIERLGKKFVFKIPKEVETKENLKTNNIVEIELKNSKFRALIA